MFYHRTTAGDVSLSGQMNNFDLHFDDLEQSIVASAEIVKEFVSFLEEMKMFYYFPFTQNDSLEKIQAQIKIDSETFKYNEAVNNLKDSWEGYASSIIPKLTLLSNNTEVHAYRCVPTFYGPYGYYYAPDTIYINITKGNSDEWIETLIHEILHLILSKEIKGMTHLEEERFIDATFVEHFGDIFPNYVVQNI